MKKQVIGLLVLALFGGSIVAMQEAERPERAKAEYFKQRKAFNNNVNKATDYIASLNESFAALVVKRDVPIDEVVKQLVSMNGAQVNLSIGIVSALRDEFEALEALVNVYHDLPKKGK